MASLARSLARPFVATGHWYSDVAKKRPVITAVITTGLKTSAADLFAQKVSFFDFDAALARGSTTDAPRRRTHLSVIIKREGGAPRAFLGRSVAFSADDERRTLAESIAAPGTGSRGAQREEGGGRREGWGKNLKRRRERFFFRRPSTERPKTLSLHPLTPSLPSPSLKKKKKRHPKPGPRAPRRDGLAPAHRLLDLRDHLSGE